MKIWGVYKVEQVGDIDYVEADELIVCFAREEDAQHYCAKHNKPRYEDGECIGDELFVKPIIFVPAGEYDNTNNYGLANEKLGPSFKCSCGHATVIPYENLETTKEVIMDNGIEIGVRLTLPFVCEHCNQTQFASDETLMFNSDNDTVRCQIANLGYNLENYIYDSSSKVRQIVARKGLGHEEFVTNPNEHPAVLREIAGQGKYLDVLQAHTDPSVSQLAKKKLLQMNASE